MATFAFNGTEADALALQAAIACYCNDANPQGERCTASPPKRCAAHQMMTDPKIVDLLLFARWLRNKLIEEEWADTAEHLLLTLPE